MLDRNASDLKKALMNAASAGAAQPEPETPIGDALRRFIDPRSHEFDQDFVDDLRSIDACWMTRATPEAGNTMH